MKFYLPTCLLLFLLIYACQKPTKVALYDNLNIQELVTPSREGGEPNLFVSETGKVYLSWVEYFNDSTDVLLFSTLEKDSWTRPQQIATGTNWFVNWADFPSIASFQDEDNTLVAHWLQKSDLGTYDYDVRLSQSNDKGKNWKPSFIPHRDNIAAEHGFVSLVPISKNRMFALWLDGRNTKTEETNVPNSHNHQSHGAMTLRSMEFDKNGQFYAENELDERVCDCCQTDAAVSSEGLIVAYRDRSEEEVRDIAILKQKNGVWEKKPFIFHEGWRITGCPVNGPALATQGKSVVVTWYSVKDNQPEVKIAFSKDAASSFFEPIRIDEGNPLGRVDVILISENLALISWLEATEGKVFIKARYVNSMGEMQKSFTIAETSAGRNSGFPILEKSEDKVIVAWTAIEDSLTYIKTAILN